jgi:hypothetical protein
MAAGHQLNPGHGKPPVSDDWQKAKDRARPLRDWAADTRRLAGKMKTEGARKGLTELAAYYDGKADEVDALIRQMTEERPDPGPPSPAPAWRFPVHWRIGGDPLAPARTTGPGAPPKIAAHLASIGARIFALRTALSSPRA